MGIIPDSKIGLVGPIRAFVMKVTREIKTDKFIYHTLPVVPQDLSLS